VLHLLFKGGNLGGKLVSRILHVLDHMGKHLDFGLSLPPNDLFFCIFSRKASKGLGVESRSPGLMPSAMSCSMNTAKEVKIGPVQNVVRA
jgi:hypothetical protein